MSYEFNPSGAGRQRYDVYSGYGNLFQAPSRGVSRPPRRGRGQTKSRQGYQTNRVENKRRTEGEKTTTGIDAMIKSTLHPGAKSSDEVLAKIGEHHTLRAITLSITTRGIGFGLCHLSYIAVSYHEIAVPSIYSQYRVFLAVLEAKLESLKTAYPLPARDADQAYRYEVNADLLHIAQTVTIAPEPIKRLINAVGIINYDEGVYIPTVSKTINDDRGRFIPQSQNLLYSSLRRTVVALADPATPERYRRRFIETNPIPGAIWQNHLLVNADEIIPADHDHTSLRDDIALLSPYLNKLQKNIPKMVDGTIDFKSSGKLSSFVCNKMSDLRAPPREINENLQDYYRRAYPLGNIREFYSYAKLPAADRLEGQINLLGEIPKFENLIYPTYAVRMDNICKYQLQTDYKAIAQILYAL